MTHVAVRGAQARRGPLAGAGEVAVWFYAALLVALSGTADAAPERLSTGIEARSASAALHDGAQGLSRPATTRNVALRSIGLGSTSAACSPAGSPVDFTALVRSTLDLECVRTHDLTRLSFGFLADRALAPPRLA